MNYKRSQTSTEFILLVGVLLFFFTIFFIAIQVNMSDKINEREDLNLKEIALTIQNEVNLAHQSDEGYYREFRIPKDIYGMDYNATIIENLIFIKTFDEKHAITLGIQNATGTIIKDKNIIKKTNGEVRLNS